MKKSLFRTAADALTKNLKSLAKYEQRLFEKADQIVAHVLERKNAPVSPLKDGLDLLSEVEGLYFTRVEGDAARFVHHSEHYDCSVPLLKLPEALTTLQDSRDFFIRLEKAGTTEVDVPKDVFFDSMSALFTEMVYSKPTNRKPTGTFERGVIGSLGAQCEKGWLVTKSKLDIKVIIDAFSEVINQMEEAAREGAVIPTSQLAAAAHPK